MNYPRLALDELLKAIAKYLNSIPPASKELDELIETYITVASSSTMTGTDESKVED